MNLLQPVDLSITLVWIIAVTVFMLLLVLAGVVLSARSFTQLMELIRYLGSLVVQLSRADPPVVTRSLQEMGEEQTSVPLEDTPITPEQPKSS